MAYNLNDFEIGESVHHLSNSSLVMVVIRINANPEEITCRWMDKAGNRHSEEFLPQELGKDEDRYPRISITTM